MNKKILVIIAILILALIGVGVFFFLKPSPQNQPEVKQTQKTTQANTGNKMARIEATLKSFLTMGKALKCTFSNNTEGVSVNGTVYAANGKIRQDFQSTAAGSTMSGHLIADSSNSYMWTDGNNQGFKFALDQVPTGQPSSGSAQSQAQDINKSMNFSCQGWSIDNSLFVLPSNVTFQSFTIPAVNPSAGSNTGNTTKSVCSACDNIPAGGARNACRTQLKCQ